MMRLEVINTGTELLLGNVTNTHLGYFGQELFSLGLRIERQVCVPDGPAIGEALRETFGRADAVLVTGGLGPTSDDVTRDLVAELLHRPLAIDQGALDAIAAYFARLGRGVDERNRRQALAPAGAEILPNPHGTAPGLYLAGDGATPHLFLLPGPPRELRPMFVAEVLPRLHKLLPAGKAPPGVRNYRTTGLGESVIAARVGPALEAIPGLELGYCARLGEVDVRCIGDENALARADEIIRADLQAYIFSFTAEELEEVVIRMLIKRRQTLAVAESCTGGLLASRLTDVPGASAALIAGWVTYATPMKTALLGVPAAAIESAGVYSEETAAAMARGAREMTGADYALSTTGVAGPGDAQGVPAGTVFIGFASENDTTAEKHALSGDRASFKRRATQAALDLLRKNMQ